MTDLHGTVRRAKATPGTKMMNPGLTKPADRDAILAYLATLK